jgi:ABC-type branched-subunit amino acid transport system substrate-binding protein
MISAQSRLPQLNGNSWLLFLLIAFLIGACTPKIRVAQAPVTKPVAITPPVKPAGPVSPPVQKASVISLILPFGLDHIGPGLSYTPTSMKEARIAADYYQGFKLALDSLTYHGYNYKLQLFDSKDQASQSHRLAYNPQVRGSDLIVGPIFPVDIKAFTSVLTSARKPIVSPLAPESPSAFKNQNLVTVNPPLEYHVWCAAQYINDNLKPTQIFILKSGYSDDNAYIIPFKKAIDTLSGGHIKVITLTVVRGQLTPLLSQLSSTHENIFIVPSTDQAFLMVTLHALAALSAQYPVTLFGHPSWERFAFLKPAVLQLLKTHITSAEYVDYKSEETITFIRHYRKAYHAEPTVYAIKGFDEGLYFGRLLATDSLKNMGQTDFTGIHNNFHFVKKPGLGWVNTHVNLLMYSNFELKP